MTNKNAWQQFKESNKNIFDNPTIEKDKIFRQPINVNFTKRELVPGIFVYQNVFPDSLSVINMIENIYEGGWQNGNIFSNEDNADMHVNKKFRDCSVVVIQKPTDATPVARDDLYYLVTESLLACYRDYLAHFSMGEHELTPDEWQVLKYGSGQHFDGHADDGFRFPRTVSITAYLNDDYTGGEIEYKHFNLKYKPEKGDVLLFPANYVYNHKVIPVETGLRYALVNWFRWKTMKVDMLGE